jgi:diaminopimelate epimerase
VIFEPGAVSQDSATYDYARVGAHLSNHPTFPEGANIEFVGQPEGDLFDVIVYERGCGLTRACGTGATAVIAAAVHSGRASAGDLIRVRLPGGVLVIEIAADLSQTWMTGPAVEVYRGSLS